MSGRRDALEPERFLPILERIRTILLDHEFSSQATVVADLIDLAHLKSSKFAEKLGGGEMWGSAGSVADAVGMGHSLEPVDTETERDSIELMRLLIRLADEMGEEGISSEGSHFVASAFRRGLEILRSRGLEV